MIRRSFIFLPYVQEKTEKTLWDQGITDWQAFFRKKDVIGFSSSRKKYYDRLLTQAQSALYSFKSDYFIGKLPNAHSWRLYDYFKQDAVFLDIETTGLSWSDDVTVVGLYDGTDTKMMIKGINLDYKGLREELSRYKLIVTFNGTSFDLPFLERRYPGLIPKVAHLDLRLACARCGLRGGLKAIEKALGISRRGLVEGMHGGDAVTLWRMYRATGDDHYLNLLVEYNEEDIINLKTIANVVYGKLQQQALNNCGNEDQA